MDSNISVTKYLGFRMCCVLKKTHKLNHVFFKGWRLSVFANELFIPFLVKHLLDLQFISLFTCLQSSFSLPCWSVIALLGPFQPPVDHWNGVKPLAGVCIVSPVCVCTRPEVFKL